jgi:phosphomannomutase
MVKDICSAHHANLRRVPTGEVYTASDAMHFHAALAGEGSCAGVIDPRVGMGRDVLVAIWHVLAALANKKQSLLTITRAYPRYAKDSRDHRTTVSIEGLQRMIEQLQVFYAGKPDLAYMSREDGLIVAFQDHSRIQVRASNTEPLLRVRSSSRDPQKAKALADEAVQAIQTHANNR